MGYHFYLIIMVHLHTSCWPVVQDHLPLCFELMSTVGESSLNECSDNICDFCCCVRRTGRLFGNERSYKAWV